MWTEPYAGGPSPAGSPIPRSTNLRMAHPLQPALWQLCTGGFGLPGFYDGLPPHILHPTSSSLSARPQHRSCPDHCQRDAGIGDGVCAHDCAEHLEGTGRKQVLAVVQMIEIAQLSVDQALDRECPAA